MAEITRARQREREACQALDNVLQVLLSRAGVLGVDVDTPSVGGSRCGHVRNPEELIRTIVDSMEEERVSALTAVIDAGYLSTYSSSLALTWSSKLLRNLSSDGTGLLIVRLNTTTCVQRSASSVTTEVFHDMIQIWLTYQWYWLDGAANLAQAEVLQLEQEVTAASVVYRRVGEAAMAALEEAHREA
eukprot:6095777-Pyramimonas_sp.AAC.1